MRVQELEQPAVDAANREKEHKDGTAASEVEAVALNEKITILEEAVTASRAAQALSDEKLKASKAAAAKMKDDIAALKVAAVESREKLKVAETAAENLKQRDESVYRLSF